MNLFLRAFLSLSLVLTFSVQAISAETLTLEQLRQEVLDENLDVKIQYEKYYQAQQNVKVQLGEFLPRLNFQLLFWNNTYSLLYSVVPTPSGWFNYQASQELAVAEKYITESIKLNILRDLTLTYISIKHQEELLKSLQREETALTQALERAQNLEDLGFGDDNQTFIAQRALLTHQQDIYALNAVMAAQKESLLLSLNRLPTQDLELAPVNQTTVELPETVEEAISLALDNSPELTANLFMAQAAQYMVSSARWSFVSFSGIGLGYPATLRIEKSQYRVIKLEGEKLENQIENQVALAYSKLENLDLRIATQEQISISSYNYFLKIKALYEVGQATLEEYVRAQREYLAEERTLTSLELQKELQIADTKRLLGLDASTTRNTITTDELDSVELMISSDSSRLRRMRVNVDVDVPAQFRDKVLSIVYSGDIFDYRLLNTNNRFNLSTRTRQSGSVEVKATILFKTGQVLELQKTIEL